jgi:hypothetical protein
LAARCAGSICHPCLAHAVEGGRCEIYSYAHEQEEGNEDGAPKRDPEADASQEFAGIASPLAPSSPGRAVGLVIHPGILPSSLTLVCAELGDQEFASLHNAPI